VSIIDPKTKIELTEGISGTNQEHLQLAERLRLAPKKKTSQGNVQGNERRQKLPFSDFF
jgi:hypothetical protein